MRRSARRFALVALACLVCGCQWYGWRPKESDPPLPAAAPRRVTALALGERIASDLRCSESDCNHWYRVSVGEAGRLRARVAPGGAASAPLVRLAIQRIAGENLALVVSETGPPVEASAQVEAGAYLVLVQSLADLSYALEVQLVSGASATPPAALEPCLDPRPEICTREWLPVCGVLRGGSQQTYGNRCTACSDPLVRGTRPGECR